MNLNRIYAECLLRIGCLLMGKKSPVGMPDDCILNDKSRFTKVHKGGRGRWRDKNGHYYEWDALHGEIEKYNSRGLHLYCMDKDGNRKKNSTVKGRCINVK